MAKCYVVFHLPSTPRTLVNEQVELAIVPRAGDSIEYAEDWGLATVESVYVCREHVEINCRGAFKDEELESLKALGWELH